MKKVDNLVRDIYQCIDDGSDIHDEDMAWFLDFMKSELITFLDVDERKERKPSIRMSNIGRDNRKLWYDFHHPIPYKLAPEQRIKFFYGHMLEAFLLLMCKIAGHDVRDMQREVYLNGITGHIDAIIDDVVVDVKSASTFGFRKFDRAELFTNDPFGYIAQISGYIQAIDNEDTDSMERGAFLAIDKTHGKLAFLPIEEMDTIDASKRIDELRAIVNTNSEPDRCHDVITEDNGNLRLCTDCNWCDHKHRCWSDSNKGSGLRTFKYSTGYKYFTHIEKEPRVEELL